MVTVTIDEASGKDLPVVLGLLYELGRPKPTNDSDVDTFKKQVTKYIKDSDKTLFVAKLDGLNIVGMISVMFLERLNQSTLEMYVPELIVQETYRGQGIGKKLINSCISLAKEKNCHRIRLESGNVRKESHQFYKSLGFEQSALSFTVKL